MVHVLSVSRAFLLEDLLHGLAADHNVPFSFLRYSLSLYPKGTTIYNEVVDGDALLIHEMLEVLERHNLKYLSYLSWIFQCEIISLGRRRENDFYRWVV